MIELTKVDGNKITINAEEVETVESNYDTTVSLKSGRKIIVNENSKIITEMVIEYKREVHKLICRFDIEKDE